MAEAEEKVLKVLRACELNIFVMPSLTNRNNIFIILLFDPSELYF